MLTSFSYKKSTYLPFLLGLSLLLPQNTLATPTDSTFIAFKTAVNAVKHVEHSLAENYLDSLGKELDSNGNGFDESQHALAQALVFHKKGVVYYRNARYEASRDNYLKAIALRKKWLPQFAPAITRGYFNLAVLNKKNGYFDKALEYLELVLKLQEECPEQSPFEIAFLIREKGRILEEKGDLMAAQEYYSSTLFFYSKNKVDYPYEIADLHNDLGTLNNRIGASQSAIQHLKLAQSIYERMKAAEDLAICFHNMGIAYTDLGQLDLAASFFGKSLQINQEEGLRFAATRNMTEMAFTFRQQESLKEANTLLQEVLQIRLAENMPKQLISSAYHNLGNLYYQDKNYTEALVYHQKALAFLVPGFSESELSLDQDILLNFSGSSVDLFHVLADQARTLAKLEGLDYQFKALATYRSLSNLVDRMRISYLSVASRQLLGSEARLAFGEAIETAYSCYLLTKDKQYLEAAFFFAEKSKALTLLDALKDKEAKSVALIPEQLLEREKGLKFKTSIYENQLYQAELAQETNKAGEIRQSLAQVKQAHRDFIRELEQKFPAYHQLKYDVAVPSVALVQQKLLDKETAFVEFILNEKSGFIFYISEAGLYVFRLETSTVRSEASELLRLLRDRTAFGTKQQFQHFQALSSCLYQQLFPFPLTYPRLIIVPDAELSYLPLEALVVESDERQPLYLIQQQAITYSWSANVLLKQKNNAPMANDESLLHFAPVRFQQHQLPDLTETEDFALSLAKRWEGKTIIGSAATKSNFRALSPAATILQVSAHASGGDTRSGPCVYLADSILYLQEVYTLDLQAQMVVLSACETALGEYRQGEGVMSLARAFAYAGVPATLTTTWKVNPSATAKLSQNYYAFLKKGLAKDVALQQAKMELIQSGDSPFFWAPFVLIGNREPLNFGGGLGMWGWVVLGAGVMVVGLFMVGRRTNLLRKEKIK